MSPPVVDVRVRPDLLAVRVAQLGADITEAYAGTRPLLVTVLKGGVFFLSDLVRHIKLPVEIGFLDLADYAESGSARIVMDLDTDIRDRHVIVVEDVIDTGLTLAFLLQVLAARQPASLRLCTLLDRRVRRIAELPLDFVGFEVGDEYLVGYGLDLDGRLRNVPAILAVTDRAALQQDPEGQVRAALAVPPDARSVG